MEIRLIKELMTAFLALQLLVPNYPNGHIQLSLDNTTAVAYLNHQEGQSHFSFQPLPPRYGAGA